MPRLPTYEALGNPVQPEASGMIPHYSPKGFTDDSAGKALQQIGAQLVSYGAEEKKKADGLQEAEAKVGLSIGVDKLYQEAAKSEDYENSPIQFRQQSMELLKQQSALIADPYRRQMFVLGGTQSLENHALKIDQHALSKRRDAVLTTNDAKIDELSRQALQNPDEVYRSQKLAEIQQLITEEHKAGYLTRAQLNVRMREAVTKHGWAFTQDLIQRNPQKALELLDKRAPRIENYDMPALDLQKVAPNVGNVQLPTQPGAPGATPAPTVDPDTAPEELPETQPASPGAPAQPPQQQTQAPQQPQARNYGTVQFPIQVPFVAAPAALQRAKDAGIWDKLPPQLRDKFTAATQSWDGLSITRQDLDSIPDAEWRKVAPKFGLPVPAEVKSDTQPQVPARTGRIPVTPEAVNTISTTAQRLGIEPRDLAAVMSYETGGTFNPDKWGGKNNNYLGLIQFGPAERKKYGVAPGMTFDDQMIAVESFLKDRGLKPGMGLPHIYSIINAGSLKNGEPRWNASDGNGTVRTHIDRIAAQHYSTADRILGSTATTQVAQVAQPTRNDATAQPEPPSAVAPQVTGTPIDFLTPEQIVTGRARADNEVKRRASARSAEYDKMLADVVAGIDTLPQRSVIDSDPELDARGKANVLRKYDRIAASVGATQAVVDKFNNPAGGTFNPYDANERKAIDWIYRQLGSDTNALQAVVYRTGFVPPSVESKIRGDLVSTDQQAVGNALQSANNLMLRNPKVFAGLAGEKQLADAAITFRHYVDDLGMTAPAAVKRYMETQTPEYQAKVTARIKSENMNELVKKNLKIADLESAFDDSTFGWRPNPSIGFDPDQRKTMYADYEELFRGHYLATGDVGQAKKLAQAELKSVWGVTSVNGSNVVMRYPPEAAPRLVGIANVSTAIAGQAVQAVADETGQKIDRSALVLSPIPGVTADAFKTGKPVPYSIMWKDKNGLLQTVQPGRGFVFDADVARSAQTYTRQEAFKTRSRFSPSTINPGGSISPRDMLDPFGDISLPR